jgi:hypothetical protein
VKKIGNIELELMTLKELKKEQQWCACITPSRKYKIQNTKIDLKT